MKHRKLAVIAGVALLGTALAVGQEEEQQKLLARRAAIADAYRKLAECVYGLEINSETYVKDFVTESDVIASDVDAFIRGIRVGDARYFPDNSCEVPAEVTVAKVIETLRESHSRHYRGNSIKSSDFVSMEQRIEKKIIKVVGQGAPREDLPPELPEGVVEELPPAPGGPPPSLYLPPLWENVSAQARLMAERAARLDALRRMAERIKGLRLTSNTLVRDFVTESDVITTELQAFLVGAEEVKRYYHDNEFIVEVTVRVPTEQVVTAVKKLHSRHYKGDDVKGTDIEKITQSVIKRDFEETGMGVPPARYMQRVQVTHVLAAPEWVSSVIKATGQGTDEAIETAQGRLRAARAAELDAKRKLVEQIGGLTISSSTLVRDFVTEYDEIASRVDALLVDSYVESTSFTGDTAVVTVGLPGARVWTVVSSEWTRVRGH